MLLKFRVQTEKGINPINLSSFLYASSSILNYDDSNFITSQINLNSPGDIIYQIYNAGYPVFDFIRTNAPFYILIYLFICGGKFKDAEFNPFISFIEKILTLKYSIKQKKIETEKYKANLKLKKLEIKERKIDIKLKEIELNRKTKEINEYLLKCFEANKSLNIKPLNDNLIDFKQIIDKNN